VNVNHWISVPISGRQGIKKQVGTGTGTGSDGMGFFRHPQLAILRKKYDKPMDMDGMGFMMFYGIQDMGVPRHVETKPYMFD